MGGTWAPVDCRDSADILKEHRVVAQVKLLETLEVDVEKFLQETKSISTCPTFKLVSLTLEPVSTSESTIRT